MGWDIHIVGEYIHINKCIANGFISETKLGLRIHIVNIPRTFKQIRIVM